jgi:hypothetical protein
VRTFRVLPVSTMKFSIRLFLPFATLALGAAPLAADDAIALKQQWQVGKKYVQSMKMVQNSAVPMGPQKMEQKMTMTMDMSTTVRKHEDGKQKRLLLRYDRMAMKMNMNGQEMGFDSTKPDADPVGMGKLFSGLIGKDLKMLVNEKDELVTIENFEEFSAAAGGMAGNPLGQMFTKESLADMIKQGSLRALPAKPVKPGNSWPWDYKMPIAQLGSAAIKGTYTLKGSAMRGGVPCAEIAVDGTLDIDVSGAAKQENPSDPTAAMLKAMGMKMTGGKMKGTLWFDNALGMARDTEITTEMEMTMNNPAAPGEKLVIPTKQAVSLTLTKVEDAK